MPGATISPRLRESSGRLCSSCQALAPTIPARVDSATMVSAVGIDAEAGEVLLQDDGRANRAEPEEQAEGGDLQRSQVKIRIHSGFSIRFGDIRHAG